MGEKKSTKRSWWEYLLLLPRAIDGASRAWPAIVAFLTGGGFMTILAAATTWINNFGPIAWGVAFFVGAYISLGVYGLVVRINKWRIQNRIAASHVGQNAPNPMSTEFQRQIVDMGKFFTPYYTPYINRRFNNCRIVGPAVICFKGSVSINGGSMDHVQIIKVKDGQVFGAIQMENPVFTDCEFNNCTFVMHETDYARFATPNSLLAQIPVVST